MLATVRKFFVALLILILVAPAMVVADTAPRPEGNWLGALDVGGTKLRLVFHVTATPAAVLAATMDSPDQGARGIPFDKVSFAPPILRLELAKIGGVFEGSLDGDALVGTWKQGGQALPLALKRGDASAGAERP